jgi:membrane associated rhomboid family serine protease
MRWYYAGFETPTYKRRRRMTAIGGLIVANLAAFFLVGLMPIRQQVWIITHLGLVPSAVLHGHVYQIISSMFLHGGLLHVGLNMFVLWMFGRDLRGQWGDVRFLKYYAICGIGSGIIATLVQPNSTIPIIGASGAIFGILLAFGITYPNRIVFLYFLFPIRAIYLVAMFAVFELLMSISGPSGGISNISHIGGMAIGFVYLKFFWKRGGIGVLGRLRSLRERFRDKRTQRRNKREQALILRVDEILDKISREGLHTLTPQERKLLDEASEMLRDRERGVRH